MVIIEFIGNPAFDGFASLGFWLLIIQIPFYATIGVFQFIKSSK